jgi:hypothetical protein
MDKNKNYFTPADNNIMEQEISQPFPEYWKLINEFFFVPNKEK